MAPCGWAGEADILPRMRGPALPPILGAARAPEARLDESRSAPLCILRDARRLGEGEGLRFHVRIDGIEREAFAVRYRGRVYAYLNACRHQQRNLDYGDARFFDGTSEALVCRHHGARYRPQSGECLSGPCAGGRLTPLAVEERNGALWCRSFGG